MKFNGEVWLLVDPVYCVYFSQDITLRDLKYTWRWKWNTQTTSSPCYCRNTMVGVIVININICLIFEYENNFWIQGHEHVKCILILIFQILASTFDKTIEFLRPRQPRLKA